MTNGRRLAGVTLALRPGRPAREPHTHAAWDVPTSVLDGARSAFDRRDVGTGLAVEVPVPPGVALLPGRPLRFATEDLQVDVRVTRRDAGLVLRVAVRPRSPVTVVVRHDGDTFTVCSSARGRCRVEHVRPGPVSLLVTSGEARTATAWTTL